MMEPKIGGLYRSITTTLELYDDDGRESHIFPNRGELFVFLKRDTRFHRPDIFLVLRVLDQKTYLWCGSLDFRFELVETENSENNIE